ncbi:FUSC family protein [Ketogulonicigenium robustum]|nr:FUSC family protein [Ketogulonicigenium robustum]
MPQTPQQWITKTFTPMPNRLRAARRDLLIAAFAAGASWLIAVELLGHQAPVFAAICAIVSLAPGLPNHGRQAVDLIIGMTLGIVVGELVWAINPGGVSGLVLLVELIVAILMAMSIAAALGRSAVLGIQAGVSVTLVLAMGPQSAGLHRLVDGGIGVVVGLLCSQFLLTPDPIRSLNTAMQNFLTQLAAGLDQAADAVEKGDLTNASHAERKVADSWGSLRILLDTLDNARLSARWSVRGRMVANPLLKTIARQNRHAVHLFANALMMTEALSMALRSGQPAPEDLPARIRAAAQHCRTLLQQAGAAGPLPEAPQVTGPWAEADEHLCQMESRLQRLVGLRQAVQRDAAAA